MNTPDLNRLVETFIPIKKDPALDAVPNWQNYLALLRTTVKPLIEEKLAKGEIRWYSFLVHYAPQRANLSIDDDHLFVHLRLEVLPGKDIPAFMASLPPPCQYTALMPPPTTLDTVTIATLAGGRPEAGWKLLGESSQWVLSLVEAHDPAQAIPLQNVRQFLHYLGNQLMVRAVKIPMP